MKKKHTIQELLDAAIQCRCLCHKEHYVLLHIVPCCDACYELLSDLKAKLNK